MRNLSKTIVSEKVTLINKEIDMINLFNLFKRTVVTVNLDANVTLKVEPVTGGVNATLTEMGEIFSRQEKAYFATLDDLCDSLRLTDDRIIRKLSKAF